MKPVVSSPDKDWALCPLTLNLLCVVTPVQSCSASQSNASIPLCSCLQLPQRHEVSLNSVTRVRRPSTLRLTGCDERKSSSYTTGSTGLRKCGEETAIISTYAASTSHQQQLHVLYLLLFTLLLVLHTDLLDRDPVWSTGQGPKHPSGTTSLGTMQIKRTKQHAPLIWGEIVRLNAIHQSYTNPYYSATIGW